MNVIGRAVRKFIPLVALAVLSACSTATDKSSLESVWRATYVFLPDRPDTPFFVGTVGLDAISQLRAGRPALPTVIFLHGCEGFKTFYHEAAFPRGLAAEGFAVFVPDSYARPGRRPACGNVRPNTVNLRRAEVREVLRRLAELPWVDSRNLFLAGFSEGGITTAMYGGDEFNAYFIAGWSCTSDNPQFDRIHAPMDRPVLAVVGGSDHWYVGSNNVNAGSCGSRLAGRPDSKSIVLPGVGHDVAHAPGVVSTLIDFFKAHIVTSSPSG